MSEAAPQLEVLNDLREAGQDALAKHFDSVRERLKRIVRFRLDYRLNGRVSESDVLQDTFVRAAKRMSRYLEQDEPLPFFVWLRLEINQRLQEIHRFHFGAEKRDVRRELNLETPVQSAQTSLAIAAHLVAKLTSPSRLVERAEQIAQLERSLNEMNELDREVIALRHFEELSNVETAKVLNIDTSAASKRYLRALKKLRQIMQAAQDSDVT